MMEMNQKRIEKWDNRYLQLAKVVASWSKDKSTKVGCVIFDDKFRLISLGYNGFPQLVEDKDEWLDNRDIKYEVVVHAETNAILFASKNLENCTIATWPLMPCSRCASVISQKGIKRVISIKNDNPRWQASFNLAKEIFTQSNIELKLYDDNI